MTPREELRKLALAATPGPWLRQSPPYHDDRDPRPAPLSSVEAASDVTIARDVRRVNANFIAAVDPQTVIALLDEIDALRDALAIAAAAAKALAAAKLGADDGKGGGT